MGSDQNQLSDPQLLLLLLHEQAHLSNPQDKKFDIDMQKREGRGDVGSATSKTFSPYTVKKLESEADSRAASAFKQSSMDSKANRYNAAEIWNPGAHDTPDTSSRLNLFSDHPNDDSRSRMFHALFGL